MHPLDWFKAQINKTISFINPINRSNSVKVTEDNYQKLYSMQNDNYTFSM